jgi:hypothetical protein
MDAQTEAAALFEISNADMLAGAFVRPKRSLFR